MSICPTVYSACHPSINGHLLLYIYAPQKPEMHGRVCCWLSESEEAMKPCWWQYCSWHWARRPRIPEWRCRWYGWSDMPYSEPGRSVILFDWAPPIWIHAHAYSLRRHVLTRLPPNICAIKEATHSPWNVRDEVTAAYLLLIPWGLMLKELVPAMT